jgi:thiamine-monophosphate kinase
MTTPSPALTEFELIARLTRDLPTRPGTVVGPGDDCAVLDLGLPDRWFLFKTDAVVEGVHFTKSAEPERVGHKALARCLSDLAAMAGTPTHALVTLALPPGFDPGFVERLYAGLKALAQRHEVALVGGETTTDPERVWLSVAVLGTAVPGKCPLRSGAKAGDALFVTGELGGSLGGKHLDFEPRLAEARWLVRHGPVHAMIDLSDGLAGDLRHVLRASGVGAELRAESLPISRAARQAARLSSSAKPPLAAALTDGEDYELLFTVAGRDAVPLLDAWKKAFPSLKLTCIGKITAAPGLTLIDKQGRRPLTADGYVHFQKP